VTQINGDLYNVRFGLVMVIATAVFAGVVVGTVQQLRGTRVIPVGLAAILLGLALAVPFVGGITTLREAAAFRSSPNNLSNQEAAQWLRTHYDHGLMLMESFGNETATFASRIPTESIIYEGSFRRWDRALADPAGYGIRWIYMRSTPGQEDDVWSHLQNTDRLKPYELVYEGSNRLVYELVENR
jgi:hypothetical protein